MKKLLSLKKLSGLLAILLLGCSQLTTAADNLEGIFKENGWDKVIGTWGGANGATTSFAWKYPGTVLESVTKMGDTERFTMLWRNAKTGTVSIVSADNKGGSSKGDCVFSPGKAVFTITSSGPDGAERSLTINYSLDGDALEVKVEGQPESVTMKRQ